MSVPVLRWPESLPMCIMPMSAQGGLRDNRISFETDGGLPVDRPRTTWTPEVYQIELAPFTIPQFTQFQLFYRNDLAFGTRPFAFFHPITGTVGAWKIMRADPPYQVTKPRRAAKGARCVSVSMTIMSWPVSVSAEYLLQEMGDLMLQEQGDAIVLRAGNAFKPLA